MKGNIGHNESVAGLANLIKASLALNHRTLPPTPHHDDPSPAIDWDSLPGRVPTTPVSLPSTGTLYAGVSAFSATGSNAHLVLSSPPAHATPTAPTLHSYILPVSARHPESLRRLLLGYATCVETQPGTVLRDMCYTAAVRRDHHRWRTAVVFSDRPTASRALRDAARDLPAFPCSAAPTITFGYPLDHPTADDLHVLSTSHPTLRHLLDNCRHDVRDRIGPHEPAQAAAHLRWTVQTALTRLWRRWGVTPVAAATTCETEAIARYAAGPDIRQTPLNRLTQGTKAEPQPGRSAGGPVPFHLGDSPAVGGQTSGQDHIGASHPTATTECLLVLGARPTVTTDASAIPVQKGLQACPQALMESIAKLYALGWTLAWDDIVPRGEVVSLPTYPWRHTRYWAPTIGGPPQHSHPVLDDRARERRSVEWRGLLRPEQAASAGPFPVALRLLLLESAAAGALRAAGEEPVHLTQITWHDSLPTALPADICVRAVSGSTGRWYIETGLAAGDGPPAEGTPLLYAESLLLGRAPREPAADDTVSNMDALDADLLRQLDDLYFTYDRCLLAAHTDSCTTAQVTVAPRPSAGQGRGQVFDPRLVASLLAVVPRLLPMGTQGKAACLSATSRSSAAPKARLPATTT